MILEGIIWALGITLALLAYAYYKLQIKYNVLETSVIEAQTQRVSLEKQVAELMNRPPGKDIAEMLADMANQGYTFIRINPDNVFYRRGLD